jgi:hypothetical protein
MELSNATAELQILLRENHHHKMKLNMIYNNELPPCNIKNIKTELIWLYYGTS